MQTLTIEILQEKVSLFNEKTKELKETFPELNEVSWSVEEIPYSLLNEYRLAFLPEKELTECGGKVYYFAQHSYGRGASIIFWSVPVKIKKIIEVEETENANKN